MSTEVGVGQELGRELRSVRELRGLSLKAVADPAEISVAYLAKLERGEVQAPSPHVLHRLAGVLSVPYIELMRLAGYVVPTDAASGGGLLTHALSGETLTDDEAKAVAAYLDVYRQQRRRE